MRETYCAILDTFRLTVCILQTGKSGKWLIWPLNGSLKDIFLILEVKSIFTVASY